MNGCGGLGVQGPRQDVNDTPNIEELKSNQDIEGLIDSLGYEPDSRIQLNALHALINIGEPAVEPLIKALKDANSEIRQRAANALGFLGDIRAVEPLIEVLNDTTIIQSNAAGALGKIGDARAVEPLIEILTDEDKTVRLDAAGALGKIGEPAVEPLIEVLRSESSKVREIVADTLIKIGDAIAVEPLIEILNKYGDKGMAEDFLNCGNAKLEEAARSWAAGNGYVVQPSSGGGPSWGK